MCFASRFSSCTPLLESCATGLGTVKDWLSTVRDSRIKGLVRSWVGGQSESRARGEQENGSEEGNENEGKGNGGGKEEHERRMEVRVEKIREVRKEVARVLEEFRSANRCAFSFSFHMTTRS